jgi:F0F1-type ATP synthase assembly protein I
MRKRDDVKNRKETFHALAMILQIGLTVLICMGMSLAIGYYIDRLFQTTIWVPIMMMVGILAAIRSMMILTGHYTPNTSEKGKTNEDSQEDSD